MPDDFSLVAQLSELASGEMKAVKAPDGVEVSLANIDGEVYAFMNMCTHEDAALNFGWLHTDTCEVECPLHEGRFDVRNGTATRDPATTSLRTYAVRVEGDDILVGPAKR